MAEVVDQIIVGNTVKTLSVSRKLITKAMYGWSKYGGVNYGLVQKNLEPIWSCQACGERQTEDLPPYMFEFAPREFVRICSKCHFKRLKENIDAFEDLITLVRKLDKLF